MEYHNFSKEELIIELLKWKNSYDSAKDLYQKEQKINEETNFLLRERMKEIGCHYKISEIMSNDTLSIGEVLNNIAETIPSGWQFPEITSACIKWNGKEFKTKNFIETRWKMESEIPENGNIIGALIVSYLPSEAFDQKKPFLNEEEELISSIAGRIGDFISRKLISESLQKSEIKYRNLIENINDVIFEIDHQGIISYISPSVERIIGYRPSEVIGKPFISFVGDNSEYLKKRFEILSKTREIKNDFKILSKTGEARWLRFSTRAITENGKFMGGTGTLVDITESKLFEIALKESEALYKSILHASPDGITLTDLDGNIRFSSPKALTMFGMRGTDEANGHPIFNFIAPEDHDRAIGNIGKMMQGNLYGADEYVGRRINGSTFDIEVNGEFVKDASGHPTGMIFITRDITERKRTEEKLRKNEETFRFLVETFNDAIYEVNSQGIINYVSPAIEKIVGYTADELIGKNFFEYMYPQDRPMLMNALANLGSNDYSYLEYRYITKDGQIRWVQSSTSPIIRDGVVVGGTGSLTNIHQRKLAEQELRKLSNAVEQSPVSIVITNMDGSIEYANPKATETTGYTLEELKGKNPRVLKSGETSIDEYSILWDTISKGNQWKGVFHNKRKNGELYWESSVISPVFNEFGVVTHYLAVKEDITERRKTEEALKRSEKRFSQLAEQSQTVIWEIDATGLYTYVNSMAEQVWGYTPEELIGKMYFYELHPEEDRLEYQKRIMIELAGKGNFKNVNNQIVTRDGRHIWVLTNCIPILDEAENLIGYRGADNDITDKLHSEEKIRAQNDRLNAIIRAIPDLMFVIDSNGIFQEYYLTDPDGFLVPEESIIGTNIQSIFDKETSALHIGMIKKCLKEKLLVTYEYSLNVKNLQSFYEARITPLKDNRVLTFVREITEKKQKDNEIKRLSLAVEQSPATIVITDLNACVEYVNPAFETTTGYDFEEVVGKSTKILKSGLTDPLLYKEMWETITSGKEWHGEWINKKKNGELFWESILITPIHDENNIITNYLAVKQDISNRKNAENEIRDLNASLEIKIGERTNQLAETNKNLLREIEERNRIEDQLEQTRQNYETFFNTIDDFLWVLDEKGSIIHVNTTVRNRLGYSNEELINQSVIGVHPPERREEASRIVMEMLAGKADFCTVPLVTKSGSPISVETRVKSGFWNSQSVIFGISKDVSKIELSEQKFSSAFRANAAMMSISRFEDGKILDVNNAFIETTGYSRDEVIGKTSTELGLFVDAEIRNDIKRRLTNNIPIIKKEVKTRIKDGSVRIGLLSADVIYIGEERCLLVVNMDITERILAEEEVKKARLEAEEANSAKSEFLSRMSHELRTPMNSILGFAQLLDMGELNPGQRKGVNHIIKSGKHLLALINEVLDISRIESGHISLSLEPIQVNSLIQEVLDLVRHQASLQQVTLSIVEPEEISLYVESDKQRLKQILVNLVNNAVKYNKSGGYVIIESQLMPPNSNNQSTVRISVRDNGIGIAKKDLPKLFNPFERIGAEKTGAEGTGLGLAVVMKLVNALKGQIGVESKEGKGSVFWVEFPYSNFAMHTLEKQSIIANLEQKLANKSGVILYIEDNLSNVELVEDTLLSQRSNIRLISEAKGSLAVPLALEYHPGLILLDMNLPDIHGSIVLQQLKSNDTTKSIPVVVISADAMPKQVEQLLMAGAHKYLTKPLDLNVLLKIIDEFIV